MLAAADRFSNSCRVLGKGALGAGLILLCSLSLPVPSSADVPRPPQLIALAFDNCTEIEIWKELTEFVTTSRAQGVAVKFTFFLSGINLLANERASLYQGPRHERGKSNIGFGGSRDNISERVALINGLSALGSEIASHAVGHFDANDDTANPWTKEEWKQEFDSFSKLYANVKSNNDLDGNVALRGSVIGFRSPYLSTTPGLYEVLAERGFRYDTSSDEDPTSWPKKQDGVWRFNLGYIPLHGTGERLISMDYNFYVAQGKIRHPNTDQYKKGRDQMIESYLDNFRTNYSGNRAPINIGHHFESYMGGAYHEAIRTFARHVCGLPEVRCVTYKELADFMDALSPSTLAAYRAGDFPHAAHPGAIVDTSRLPEPAFSVSVHPDGQELRASVGANAPDSRIHWRLGGTVVGQDRTLGVSSLPRNGPARLSAGLIDKEGKTIAEKDVSVTLRDGVIERPQFHEELHLKRKP